MGNLSANPGPRLMGDAQKPWVTFTESDNAFGAVFVDEISHFSIERTH